MTAIATTDVIFKLSAPNAVAGNVVAGYSGTSWGGHISTTVLSPTALDNIFPDITGPENAAGQVDYACLFIHNNTNTGNSMVNTIAWIPSQLITGTGSSIAIAADPVGITAINSSSSQAAKITSAVTAPAGVSGWVNPVSSTPSGPLFTNGLQLGTILPGQCAAIWIRRTALNSSGPSLTSIQVEVSFNTHP